MQYRYVIINHLRNTFPSEFSNLIKQMAVPRAHKLVEKFHVAPASHPDCRTRTTSSLPLSFLDLPLAGPIYVKRQFFYHFPHPVHHFCETKLPTLKHSLSLTLQHFFPLAGNLLCPPPPHRPFIRRAHDDTVTLTIVESEADFNHLSSNHPKSGDTDEDFVKATAVFGKDDIEGLKRWALNQWKKDDELNSPQNLSKFVVTCAFVWASLVKTRCRNDDEINDKEEYFRFAADCRDRLEYAIPETYFGNCLTLCYAILKSKDLKGEGGFLSAVKVIERAVTDMKSEPFKDAKNWRALFMKMFVLGSTLLVTGSPKFTVYETDFGFGRPTKVEMVHPFKCMSLAESGDEEGGLEVGLVCRSTEFEIFISAIEQGLEASKS
ncbi:Coumaroyl-CoA:anthocyanidin 3-O-glucoside-6''-O-coumaroyltransferase 1 [Spatholobus suberectus]|nr:Coumaroyl-CoA:anthocyanidin 3-O-glucoside-6''-O-coumaroyltransferase 1 [Spatholobus suberectus]